MKKNIPVFFRVQIDYDKASFCKHPAGSHLNCECHQGNCRKCLICIQALSHSAELLFKFEVRTQGACEAKTGKYTQVMNKNTTIFLFSLSFQPHVAWIQMRC